MAATTGQLDNSIEIVTPENIAFRYQVAGPFRRVPAYLIDLLIRGFMALAAFIAVSFAFGALGLFGLALDVMGLFWLALAWFYGGFFETYWNGQTPGKRLMQIRVQSIEGQPISGLQAVLRNVLRTVDVQPAGLCLVGLVSAAMNDRFQRLGDLATGTMVVVEEGQWFSGVTRINHPEAKRLAGQIPVGFQASRTLARALAMYVQRRMQFNEMRRSEIARHLGEPLRDRFALPADTNLDLLLCGLYQRTFITDSDDEEEIRTGSPFRESQSPFAAPDERPPETVEATVVDEPEARKWSAADSPRPS